MGLGSLRGVMWAGVMDGHVATDDRSTDEYTPLTVALFKTKAEAQQRYERVVKVDVDALLRIEDK
ncbi:DUF1330 domain-containing protein [Hyphomicrobium sp. 1Nfss2.1]|uniref:hypothetical protein n=1 Tax=Hyphomicrobium sp. 1Nfss2.1 TaxID=3413936 RepID=UPI003C7E969E